MSQRIRKGDNLLDLIPVKNQKYEYIMKKDGIIQILIPRNGIMDKLVRKFRKTPKVMKIDLDAYGSQVWNEIDGNKNIGEIGKKLKMTFGKEVEPLYERLGAYMNILRNNEFIILRRKL